VSRPRPRKCQGGSCFENRANGAATNRHQYCWFVGEFGVRALSDDLDTSLTLLARWEKFKLPTLRFEVSAAVAQGTTSTSLL
jgi:hypothetical protein